MSVQLAPLAVAKFFDNNGEPLFNGQLFTYAAGTTTPLATFTDSTGGTQNTNPVILNPRGECNLWLSSVAYKLQLQDSFGNIIWTVDNVIGYGLSQTPAESAAGVTPTNLAYPQGNLLRYGADPTGTTASDPALSQALAVCGATGGRIHAPGGVYTFASQISLLSKLAIIIEGDGSGGGAQTATQFKYTGTASPWIDMRNAVGCQFRDIQLTHSNGGFTGTYIKCGNGGVNDPTFCGTFNVLIGNSVSATVHLDLDKCTLWTSSNTNFVNGNPSVKGQSNAGGSYANAIRFRDCLWQKSQIAPIQDGGQAWEIDSCTFEGISAGSAVNAFILSSNANGAFLGLKITGCWIGDCNTTAGTLISLLGSQGVEISGNYLSGNTNTTAIAMGGNCQGWSIVGNLFIGHLNGINFASTVCGNISVKGNVATSVTNPWENTGNCTFGTLDVGPNFGFGLPSGHYGTGLRTNPDQTIEQWGSVSVTNGTPSAVSFTPNFPNAVQSIQLTMRNAGSGLETYTTSESTSGFSINVAGGVGTTSVYWKAIGN